MKLYKNLLSNAVSPVLSKAILALSRSSVRSALGEAGDIDAITDNSGGTSQGYTLPMVPTQNTKGEADGSNMVARAEFNTAITAVGNALSVLMEHLNDNGLSILGLDTYGEGDGTIAVSGTVAAIDTSMTASDGSGDAAMLRTEMNAALVRARNNLAKVCDAYNTLAYAIGTQVIVDGSLGTAAGAEALDGIVTAGTTVDSDDLATTDVALKTAADTALGALADGVATLATKIDSDIFASGTRALDGDSVVVVTR